jgi:hypothetical protein
MEAAPASTDGQEQPAEEPPGCRCDIPGEYDKFTFAKTRARESGPRAEAWGQTGGCAPPLKPKLCSGSLGVEVPPYSLGLCVSKYLHTNNQIFDQPLAALLLFARCIAVVRIGVPSDWRPSQSSFCCCCCCSLSLSPRPSLSLALSPCKFSCTLRCRSCNWYRHIQVRSSRRRKYWPECGLVHRHNVCISHAVSL